MIGPLGAAPADGNIQQLASGGNSISFSKKLSDDFTLTATLKDVKLNADMDWSFKPFRGGLKINRIYMAVDYTTEVVLESKEFKYSDSIEESLIKKNLSEPSLDVGKLSVYICPGISVNLRVKLSVDASCKVKVTVTTENTKGFEMKGSSIRGINDTKSYQDTVLTGKAGAYMTLILALSLDYVVGEVDLLSLELKVGPTIEAEVKIHDESGTENDMLCIDVEGYLVIELKVVYLKKLMDLLNLPSSQTLVDIGKDNSPIKFHFHLENFENVGTCTMNGEQATEEATQEETIPVGIFALENSYLSLDVGSSGTIVVKSLPSGYSASDIVWTSSDPSKVSVDAKGNVTAVSAGTVSITASTKDGKYTALCAIISKSNVAVSYNNNYSIADGAMAA